MEREILLASQFAAAALMFALAGWLLYLNFNSRLNRAFALFLFLRGMVIVINRAPELFEESRTYLQGLGTYYLIGAGLALTYFAVIYPKPPKPRVRAMVFTGIVLVAVLGEVAYARDHCLVTCLSPDGDRVGPLAPLALLVPIVSGIAAWRLAARATPGGPGTSALRTVAAGFALNAVLDASLSVSVMIAQRDVSGGFLGAPWSYLPHPMQTVAIAPLIAFVAAMWAAPRRVFRTMMIALAAASATGLLVGSGSADRFAIFLLGLWRLALPLLVGYALLRQSLFDLDTKLRFTLRQSTIGAAFIAVFVVVSEIGTQFVSSELGGYLGIGAAVLLVFALAPLQLVAEKLARSALPRPPPGRDLPSGTRNEIYREQVALSWADGALDRSERLVLERLREALDLPQDVAAAIELEVARKS